MRYIDEADFESIVKKLSVELGWNPEEVRQRVRYILQGQHITIGKPVFTRVSIDYQKERITGGIFNNTAFEVL